MVDTWLKMVYKKARPDVSRKYIFHVYTWVTQMFKAQSTTQLKIFVLLLIFLPVQMAGLYIKLCIEPLYSHKNIACIDAVE